MLKGLSLIYYRFAEIRHRSSKVLHKKRLDIAESLNRYDLVPVSRLREYAEKDLKSQGISIPEHA